MSRHNIQYTYIISVPEIPQGWKSIHTLYEYICVFVRESTYLYVYTYTCSVHALCTGIRDSLLQINFFGFLRVPPIVCAYKSYKIRRILFDIEWVVIGKDLITLLYTSSKNAKYESSTISIYGNLWSNSL